jgi:hypothetical protein
MVMDAIGIKKHQTFIEYLHDLVDWGFITMVQKSTNQYSANIISLQNALPKPDKAHGKALDKAMVKHRAKQGTSTGQSTGQSKDSINKQVNIEPINQEQGGEGDGEELKLESNKIDFEVFWDLYDKKSSDKKKSKKMWDKLSRKVQEQILVHVAAYKAATTNKQYRKNTEAYLNQEHWNNEIEKPDTCAPILPDGTKPYNQNEDLERQRQAYLMRQQQNRLNQATA